MYSLVTAYSKVKGVNQRWIEKDISTTPINELYRDNEEIYVELTNPLYPSTRVLKLSDVKAQYRYITQTFPEMFSNMGNASLPTVAGTVVIKQRHVRYREAVQAQYQIQPITDNLVIGSNESDDDRIHLSLTRSDVDYADIGKYCLAVVNGLIHRLDFNSQMVVIYNGNKHSKRAKRTSVGLLNFKDVGELFCLPIEESMIGRRSTDNPLSNKLYITIDQEYSQYTPMIVVGGYLYPCDPKYFYNVDPKTYCFETARIPLLARYMESREFGGYDLPNLQVPATNEHMIAVDEFFSDEKLKSLFCAKESFLVFIKSDDLYTSRDMLRRSLNPGTYVIDKTQHQHKPMIAGYGMFANYLAIDEGKRYAIKTDFRYRVRYNFLTTDSGSQVAIDDTGYSGDPLTINDCFFLTIGKDELFISEV